MCVYLILWFAIFLFDSLLVVSVSLWTRTCPGHAMLLVVLPVALRPLPYYLLS